MNILPLPTGLPPEAIDAMIARGSGAEPNFDAVTQTNLRENEAELMQRCEENSSLLDFASLGQNTPWLYRLTFHTKGFVRDGDGDVEISDRHTVALRFLPDYLRKADRFAMLSLIEPINAFHPNIKGGAICVEIYAGEPLVEICQSLHDLFRWRLRQYDERDALNAAACAWGRQNIQDPVDDRPLFGKRMKLNWERTGRSAKG